MDLRSDKLCSEFEHPLSDGERKDGVQSKDTPADALQLKIEEHQGHLSLAWTLHKKRVDAPIHVLCVSDTHDQHMFMPNALPKADILVHAGDLTCRGGRDELESFNNWVGFLLASGTVQVFPRYKYVL